MKEKIYLCVCVYTYACVHTKLVQLCPTLCDPMDCSLPGSSVHGILQARIQEWVTPSSRRSWEGDPHNLLQGILRSPSIYLSIYLHTHTYMCIYMCVKTWRDNITWVFIWRTRFEERGEDVRIELLGNKDGDQQRNSDWMSCAIFSRAEESKHQEFYSWLSSPSWFLKKWTIMSKELKPLSVM